MTSTSVRDARGLGVKGDWHLQRREFIALLGMAAAWPKIAVAQRLERKLCVVLATKPSAEYQNALAAFDQTLESLGWKRGNNLRVDQFWSAGDQGYEHALAVANDVLALNPDVILAQSAAVVSAVRSSTRSIPVVFVHVADPVSSGFVSNIAKPDGNITGVTNTVPSLGGKWLQILKDMVPGLGRAAMLVYPETQQRDRAFFLNPFEEAARSLGIRIVKGEVKDLQDIESVFASLAASGPAGAVVVTPHASFANHSREIVTLAERFQIPASYPYRYYAAQGGLMSYGVNNLDLFKQAAPYVDKILRGAKPSDLPVQQPTRFDLIINMKTAKALRLSITAGLLASVDEVIE
jgi:putative tryptophan/tyrosine transport system substrate-binding protein